MLERCGDRFLLCLPSFLKEEAQKITVWTSDSMATSSSCSSVAELECRNVELAFHLKLGAMLAILCAGATGVALPLFGKRLPAFKTDGPYFAVAKAFAAGVILATGFVHMLSDAVDALTDSCLPDYPWRQFPFSGCIAMMAALGTLLVDVIGTEYYERKHAKEEAAAEQAASPLEWDNVPSEASGLKETHSSGHLDTNHIHVVGMRAHAASHTHSHSHDLGACGGLEQLPKHNAHGHTKPTSDEDMAAHIRHVVVSQAGFRSFSTIAMTVCFTLTTPLGIAVGTGISSGYNSNSPGALIVEGIFDSVSAGILIYMALVDLIAADFLSKRMCCNRVLQVLSYISLFFGAAAMSALAVWA